MFHSPRQQLWGDKGWHAMETLNTRALRGQGSWAAPLILSVGSRPVPGSGHWGAKPVKHLLAGIVTKQEPAGRTETFQPKNKGPRALGILFCFEKRPFSEENGIIVLLLSTDTTAGSLSPSAQHTLRSLGDRGRGWGATGRPQWGGNCPSVQNTHLQGMWGSSQKGWLHRGCASCLKVCWAMFVPSASPHLLFGRAVQGQREEMSLYWNAESTVLPQHLENLPSLRQCHGGQRCVLLGGVASGLPLWKTACRASLRRWQLLSAAPLVSPCAR